MKKYKLLKNLPLAKEGATVEVVKNKGDTTLYRIYENGENSRDGKLLGSIYEKDFSEWLEEIPEKLKSVWELKNGDKYYFLGCNECIYDYWRDSNADRQIRDIGNCFLTQKEAQKELQKRKAIQKIKKYCWENNIDTKHNGDVYSSYAFNLNDSGEVVFFGDLQNGNPLGYFSHENAQKILDKFEEELKIILE